MNNHGISPLICYLDNEKIGDLLPASFPNPFNNTPHAVARIAGSALQERLDANAALRSVLSQTGKMFGVLVVSDKHNRIGYLSAFAGQLENAWLAEQFVPPVFDIEKREQLEKTFKREFALCHEALANAVEQAQLDTLIDELRRAESDAESQIANHKQLLKQNQAHRKQLRKEAIERADSNMQAVLDDLALQSQADKRSLSDLKHIQAERISSIQTQIDTCTDAIQRLKARLVACKTEYQSICNSLYQINNAKGEVVEMSRLIDTEYVPEGMGDCAAIKLMNYALKHELTPLALTEFWMGAPPNGEIRQHRRFYPPCRGRCRPLLSYMLDGISVEDAKLGTLTFDASEPTICYEDDAVVVVNKPHGMLSVPGKTITDSVLTRLRGRYPDATGPLLLHRLDMSTSGLLLAAKNERCHRLLQHQFESRRVKKRYVAMLSRRLSDDEVRGEISLPLAVDLADRPRQLVSNEYGRTALTHWEVVERYVDTTRVWLYPITGRTHQLRVHAAHVDGLNAPIVGDELYGIEGDRLLLHAESISFTHPVSQQRMTVECPAEF